MILQKGSRRRAVRINSEELRRELARVELTRPNLLFHVTGSDLMAVVVDLDGPGGPPRATEGGIEGPLPEPPAPTGEAANTDYPLATRFVAAKYYRKSTSPRAIGRVVIHITDGGSRIDGTLHWFQNPVNADGTVRKVSAHYIVGQNGEVVQMVRDDDIAYHAGSANADSIGIEHNARSPRTFNAADSGLYPTAIRYACSAALVRWLCEEHGIPMDREHILGHAEADPRTSHTKCPNAVWDWDYFMEMVTSAMSLPPR
jgi:hypothetical protein